MTELVELTVKGSQPAEFGADGGPRVAVRDAGPLAALFEGPQRAGDCPVKRLKLSDAGLTLLMSAADRDRLTAGLQVETSVRLPGLSAPAADPAGSPPAGIAATGGPLVM